MKITDVRIRKIFENGPLLAVCSVTFEECIVVHDIKLVSAKGRKIVAMPSRKRPDGEYSDIVHPINSAVRKSIEDAVLEAYSDAINNEQKPIY